MQLFKESLSDFLRQRSQAVRDAAQSIPDKRLFDTPLETWAEHLHDRHALAPIELAVDEIETSEPVETTLDISRDTRFAAHLFGERVVTAACALTFHIPYRGDSKLLSLRPSSSYLSPMRAQVVAGELRMTYIDEAGMFSSYMEAIRREFEHEFGLIREVAGNVDREVADWNAGLRRQGLEALTARKQRLEAANLSVNALGYPVRRRDGAPATYAAPEIRRRVEAPRPTPPRAPEPALDFAEYENILRICTSMTSVIERSPRVFAEIGEEDIRTHFLIQLNGQYEGQATGETFNGAGKTDILVRHGDRNIFIAECKFWTGPEGFRKAIDQLLSYATWRDGKLALFVFNRDRRFSTVLTQLDGLVRAHPAFLRAAPSAHASSVRAVVRHPDDASRELVLTVIAFEVPSAARVA